jgi:hypothetical protein
MKLTNQTPIEKLKLSIGIYRILKRNHFDYVEQISQMEYKDFMAIYQCGSIKAQEIILALSKFHQEQAMLQNEYHNLQQAVNILKSILERESKRHQMDQDLVPGDDDVVQEAIGLLEEIIDYDPTPNELGEPPITLDEMHTAAWKEHQAMHS